MSPCSWCSSSPRWPFRPSRSTSGVAFRLGRLVGTCGPGLFLLIPYVERIIKVDLGIVTIDVPSQEAVTRDNVSVRVNTDIYFPVMDPEEAIIRATACVPSTSQISQTTLRSVLGQSDLDELLAERDRINLKL